MISNGMKKIIAAFVLSLGLHAGALGQPAPLDTLVKKFSEYREKTLQEKLYVHTDRTFYLTGETFWFKVYAVDATFRKPLGVSTVAYAELLDRTDFAVLQAKIELKSGCGSGSFFLPASLSSGNYKLRVYTNWMKNFDPEFFFREEITIVNPFVVPESPLPATAHNHTVEFFPEGGYLVNGIRSTVGFKVSDTYGRGVGFGGFIVNDHRDTVASFRPGKFGIGHFAITPHADEQYKAVLIGPGGVRSIHNFPKAQVKGYVMQLVDSGEQVIVNVRTRDVGDRELLLFVHALHITSHALRQPLSRNGASFVIRKSEMAKGISHFTVFNEQLKPVCERLYFMYPGKKLSIVVLPNQKIYGPRQKVSLAIETTGNGSPGPANLSVSVYKIDSLGHDPVGIYPYLWLTSDLTGRIESPGYYFDNSSTEASMAMNDLMLTHGWRRFDWRDVLGEPKKREFLPEVNGHIITGVVTRDQQPQHGVFTYLGSPGKIVRAYGSWSNAEGEVRYEIKDFYGPRKIILQTRADSTRNFSIQLGNPFSTAPDKTKLPPLILEPKLKDALAARSIAMQVQDIYYYNEYGNRFAKPTVDSVAFYGNADATYYLDDYTRFPVMEEVMREYVPGVFVRKRKDGFHFIVVDVQNKGVLSGDPMILLDGVPVLDTDDIMKVDPLTVKKLEVIQREYFLGQAVFSGIVSYSTYNGDLGNLQLDPKSVSLNYEGLQLRREFYSPQYSYRDEKDRMPDQRHLLYWNPDVTTEDNGKQQVGFYTSDVDGQYRVVIQAVDKQGYSGTATCTFTTHAADDQ